MSNFINKYLNQSAYDADSTKQYPNTSLVGTDVVFQMSAPAAFGGLTVKYEVEDTTSDYPLFNNGTGSEPMGGMPTTMIVDGVSETPINVWRFTTTGEHIVQYEFTDNIIPDSMFANVEGSVGDITEVIIGNDIESTGEFTFGEMQSLISVTIGSGITEIEGSCFFGCFGLSRVNSDTDGECIIPSGITSIGEEAFESCTSLATVTIPSSVTSIGDMVFQSCNSLESVTILATTPPMLGMDTFIADDNEYPIYVPAASVETYKAASGWSDYAERIFAIP